MKVALVYDRINKWGGAERVLLALKEVFPDAPLYTSVYNSEKAAWANSFDIRTSFLQKFPYATSHHELLATLMPITFESFSFDEYELVISVTSESAKGIITKPHTKHLCICLTPTRYLWSGYEEYFKKSHFRFFTKPIVSYLRLWDIVAGQRPDGFIAISKEVQKRIKKYYKRNSTVIYPPVNLMDTTRIKTKISNDNLENDYFLVVSRLVPYKKVEIAIEACNTLQIPLKIIGNGSEEIQLRQKAGPTIQFLGNLTDKALIQYYKNCKALLFPGIEDLGLTIIEAQKYGKPVIAYKGGGALETVIEGETGTFFYPQTKNALIKSIQSFLLEQKNLSQEKKNKQITACQKQAQKFSQEIFKEKLLEYINNTL